VPKAHAEDGRWFVQAYGGFALQSQAHIVRPAAATLTPASASPAVRLHLLGEGPLTLYTAFSRDPASVATGPGADRGRAGLIVRRRSTERARWKAAFVTVYEPPGGSAIQRIGRVKSPEGTVVLYLESADEAEHLIFNLVPGRVQVVQLADGHQVTTDGHAVRVR